MKRLPRPGRLSLCIRGSVRCYYQSGRLLGLSHRLERPRRRNWMYRIGRGSRAACVEDFIGPLVMQSFGPLAVNSPAYLDADGSVMSAGGRSTFDAAVPPAEELFILA
jgi:hypothetical protein